MSCTEESKNDIRTRLAEIYADTEPEGLVLLLHFLDSADAQYAKETGDATASTPFWRTLNVALQVKKDALFKDYADRLIKDARQVEKNPAFLKIMTELYENMTSPCDESYMNEDQLMFKENLTLSEKSLCGPLTGLGIVWDVMTPTARKAIAEVIKRYATYKQCLIAVDDAVSVLNKYGGAVVMVALSATMLAYEVIVNIRKWIKGEISGKRCAKNCFDSLGDIAGGVAGGYGGATGGAIAGSAICPGIGTVVGGLIGGVAGGMTGSYLGKTLFDRLTRQLFDLPKEEAVEKAYKLIGVHHKASNNEVNSAFRKLCLKHHPDKGGNVENFYQVQFSMELIRNARGELR